MGAAAGWRIVKGRARYWDGEQWVGGDFDPATVSPQLLAESAGVASPSVERAVRTSASPSIATSTSMPAPSVGPAQAAPAPSSGSGIPAPSGSKAAAQAQAKATAEAWANDLMHGRLPGSMDPSAPRTAPAQASAPAAGSTPIGAPTPQPVKRPQTSQRKGISIGRIVGLIIAGWFLFNFLGSIFTDVLP